MSLLVRAWQNMLHWRWWKWKSLSCVDSLRPHELYSPWNSPGQNIGVVIPFPSPGDLPNPGIKLSSPLLQVSSLPAEPPGETKNTGVGSHSLLQHVFPTQESNWSLLHCRQVLYQLSYQGSSPLEKGMADHFSILALRTPWTVSMKRQNRYDSERWTPRLVGV